MTLARYLHPVGASFAIPTLEWPECYDPTHPSDVRQFAADTEYHRYIYEARRNDRLMELERRIHGRPAPSIDADLPW